MDLGDAADLCQEHLSINQFGLGTTTTKNHALESNDLADSGSFQSSTAAVQVQADIKQQPQLNFSTLSKKKERNLATRNRRKKNESWKQRNNKRCRERKRRVRMCSSLARRLRDLSSTYRNYSLECVVSIPSAFPPVRSRVVMLGPSMDDCEIERAVRNVLSPDFKFRSSSTLRFTISMADKHGFLLLSNCTGLKGGVKGIGSNAESQLKSSILSHIPYCHANVRTRFEKCSRPLRTRLYNIFCDLNQIDSPEAINVCEFSSWLSEKMQLYDKGARTKFDITVFVDFVQSIETTASAIAGPAGRLPLAAERLSASGDGGGPPKTIVGAPAAASATENIPARMVASAVVGNTGHACTSPLPLLTTAAVAAPAKGYKPVGAPAASCSAENSSQVPACPPTCLSLSLVPPPPLAIPVAPTNTIPEVGEKVDGEVDALSAAVYGEGNRQLSHGNESNVSDMVCGSANDSDLASDEGKQSTGMEGLSTDPSNLAGNVHLRTTPTSGNNKPLKRRVCGNELEGKDGEKPASCKNLQSLFHGDGEVSNVDRTSLSKRQFTPDSPSWQSSIEMETDDAGSESHGSTSLSAVQLQGLGRERGAVADMRNDLSSGGGSGEMSSSGSGGNEQIGSLAVAPQPISDRAGMLAGAADKNGGEADAGKDTRPEKLALLDAGKDPMPAKPMPPAAAASAGQSPEAAVREAAEAAEAVATDSVTAVANRQEIADADSDAADAAAAAAAAAAEEGGTASGFPSTTGWGSLAGSAAAFVHTAGAAGADLARADNRRCPSPPLPASDVTVMEARKHIPDMSGGAGIENGGRPGGGEAGNGSLLAKSMKTDAAFAAAEDVASALMDGHHPGHVGPHPSVSMDFSPSHSSGYVHSRGPTSSSAERPEQKNSRTPSLKAGVFDGHGDRNEPKNSGQRQVDGRERKLHPVGWSGGADGLEEDDGNFQEQSESIGFAAGGSGLGQGDCKEAMAAGEGGMDSEAFKNQATPAADRISGDSDLQLTENLRRNLSNQFSETNDQDSASDRASVHRKTEHRVSDVSSGMPGFLNSPDRWKNDPDGRICKRFLNKVVQLGKQNSARTPDSHPLVWRGNTLFFRGAPEQETLPSEIVNEILNAFSIPENDVARQRGLALYRMGGEGGNHNDLFLALGSIRPLGSGPANQRQMHGFGGPPSDPGIGVPGSVRCVDSASAASRQHEDSSSSASREGAEAGARISRPNAQIKVSAAASTARGQRLGAVPDSASSAARQNAAVGRRNGLQNAKIQGSAAASTSRDPSSGAVPCWQLPGFYPRLNMMKSLVHLPPFRHIFRPILHHLGFQGLDLNAFQALNFSRARSCGFQTMQGSMPWDLLDDLCPISKSKSKSVEETTFTKFEKDYPDAMSRTFGLKFEVKIRCMRCKKVQDVQHTVTRIDLRMITPGPVDLIQSLKSALLSIVKRHLICCTSPKPSAIEWKLVQSPSALTLICDSSESQVHSEFCINDVFGKSESAGTYQLLSFSSRGESPFWDAHCRRISSVHNLNDTTNWINLGFSGTQYDVSWSKTKILVDHRTLQLFYVKQCSLESTDPYDFGRGGFCVGDWVLARFYVDNRFYAARITTKLDDGEFKIFWDSGETTDSEDTIKHKDDFRLMMDVNTPGHFHVGQRVMAKRWGGSKHEAVIARAFKRDRYLLDWTESFSSERIKFGRDIEAHIEARSGHPLESNSADPNSDHMPRSSVLSASQGRDDSNETQKREGVRRSYTRRNTNLQKSIERRSTRYLRDASEPVASTHGPKGELQLLKLEKHPGIFTAKRSNGFAACVRLDDHYRQYLRRAFGLDLDTIVQFQEEIMLSTAHELRSAPFDSDSKSGTVLPHGIQRSFAFPVTAFILLELVVQDQKQTAVFIHKLQSGDDTDDKFIAYFNDGLGFQKQQRLGEHIRNTKLESIAGIGETIISAVTSLNKIAGRLLVTTLQTSLPPANHPARLQISRVLVEEHFLVGMRSAVGEYSPSVELVPEFELHDMET